MTEATEVVDMLAEDALRNPRDLTQNVVLDSTLIAPDVIDQTQRGGADIIRRSSAHGAGAAWVGGLIWAERVL